MWIDPLGLTADDIIRYKPRDSLSAQSGNRRTAITRAWEKALLQNGGKGTRAWTAEERALILNTPNSQLTSVMSKAGYTGHHINSVEGNGSLGAKWMGDPRNIVFLKMNVILVVLMNMFMCQRGIKELQEIQPMDV